MVDLGALPSLVGVTLLFLLPPGPDMAYMVAVGLEGGRRAAVKAILGIATGMSVYAAAVVVGVGAFAQSHPLLLDAITLFGAGYLLWLAYVTVRNARRKATDPSEIAAGPWYLRGVLVSLTNPKIMLFFLAVLPGFVGDARNVTLQLAVLGAANVLTEVLLYGGIGLLAGGFHARISGARTARSVLNYVAGAVYLALASAFAGELLLA
jgi:threonine/homoserine/homoserine lactone efflux protein